MKKINFNQPITDLDGKDLKKGADLLLVKNIVSNALINSQRQQDPIKVLDLALKIYNSKEALELDPEKIKIITDIVKQGQSPVLIQGQILKLLSKE